MEKYQSILVTTGLAILLLINLYFAYALFDMNRKVFASGLSCSSQKTAMYNFSGAVNAADLPDMAGGC